MKKGKNGKTSKKGSSGAGKPPPQTADEIRKAKRSISKRQRRTLIKMLTIRSELLPELCIYVREHQKAFIAAGVRDKALSNISSAKMYDVAEMIFGCQDEAFEIVTKWIAQKTAPAVREYVYRCRATVAARKAEPGVAPAATAPIDPDEKLEYEKEVAEQAYDIFCAIASFMSKNISVEPQNAKTKCEVMLGFMFGEITEYSDLAWKACDISIGTHLFGHHRQEIPLMLDLIFGHHEKQDALVSIFDRIVPKDRKAMPSLETIMTLAAAVEIRVGNYGPHIRDAIADIKEKEMLLNKDETSPISDRLSKELSAITPEYGIRAKRIHPAVPDQFNRVDDLEVLSQCMKVVHDHPAYAFSRVIAVREIGSNEWFDLTDDERRRLFPKSGDLIHFSGRNFPELPKQDSLRVWRVNKQTFSGAAEHRNSVMVTQRLMRCQQILVLEHITSDMQDHVREWITENLSLLEEYDQGSLLLHLKDGRLINGQYSDLVRDGFTQQVRSWKTLDMHQTATGKVLYIGDLPTAGTYDMAPPVRVAIKAVRDLGEFTAEEIHRINHALELLSSHEALVERLASVGIEDLKWDEESLIEVKKHILRLPEIKSELEQAKAEVREQAEEELTTIRANINRATETHAEQLKIIKDFANNKSRMIKELNSELNKILKKCREEGHKFAMRMMYEQGIQDYIKKFVPKELDKKS